MTLLNGNQSPNLSGTPPFDGETGNPTFTALVEKIVSAIRTFTANVISVGNIKVDTTGADAMAGRATLSGGTVTVATTKVKTGSIILLTPIGATNAGLLSVGTITNNTSFVINSASGTDARVVCWTILEPIA